MSGGTQLVQTPRGPAGLALTGNGPDWLLLGHGAGGHSWSADLLATRDAAVQAGWSVALVDQPWRVAGRKVADRPAALDEAWIPVAGHVREALGATRLVVGGRSAGARVACRTSVTVGAAGVLCLAFPLHPPGKPEASRADELAIPLDAGLPIRVVQGQRDPFGSPEEVRASITDPGLVVSVPGTHTIGATEQVREVVGTWLDQLRE